MANYLRVQVRWMSVLKQSQKEPSKLIFQELGKRYFRGAKEALENKNKKFEASDELTRPEVSLKMIPFPVTNINDENYDIAETTKGKVSLLLIGWSEFTRPQVESFVTPFMGQFLNDKDVQCYQVSVLKPFYKYFRSMLNKQLKTIHPPHRHPYISFFLGDTATFEKKLEMPNRYTAHAFLIDKNSKIRWKAHALATQNEIKNLIALTHVLKKE